MTYGADERRRPVEGIMRSWLKVVAGSVVLAGGVIVGAGGAGASTGPASSVPGDQAHACPAPPVGYAKCGAVELVHPGQNWHPSAHPAHPSKGNGHGPSSTSPPTSGYFPIDLQSAYGLTAAISQAAATGPGPTAPTIAIVDAYDDPSAASDLAAYRTLLSGAQDSHTGLTDKTIPPLCSSGTSSPCVTFTKVNQSGGTSYPRGNSGWAEEISLDLDMISAVCPDCNITLVEASSSSFADLQAAVAYAKSLHPAAVTNSYGGSEFSTEVSSNSTYSSTSSTAVTAATGDTGYGVEFPAAAPAITAVGGTSLTYSGTGTGLAWSQTVWSGSGAGCSAYESQPSWQQAPYSTSSVCNDRQVGDLAAVADPNTGVAVYDTYKKNGWMVFGGTSVSTQVIGGMYGLAAFAGTEQGSPQALYTNASGNLVPVASGTDGSCGTYLCNAADSLSSGYNGPAGLGTPEGIGAFTGAAPAPGFTLSATPSSARVTAGTAAAYTITVTPSGGFSGAVGLTTSCPSGTSCTFSASSVTVTTSTAVSSTLTVTTTSSIAAGTYTVTVTGTSGTRTAATAVSLAVGGSTTGTTAVMTVTVQAGAIVRHGPHFQVPITVTATTGTTATPLSGASATLDVYAGSTCAGSPVATGTGTTGTNGQVSFKFNTHTSGTWCAAAHVADAGYTTGAGTTVFST